MDEEDTSPIFVSFGDEVAYATMVVLARRLGAGLFEEVREEIRRKGERLQGADDPRAREAAGTLVGYADEEHIWKGWQALI